MRHWAKRQELLERLAPKIADMRAALQAVVAETQASKLNDNTKFGSVFGRVIEVSEEKHPELAEAVWQDGEAARGRGEAHAEASLFEKAIDARGRGLCADDKQGSDRIVAMRLVVMGAWGVEDKEMQAWAKMTPDVACVISLKRSLAPVDDNVTAQSMSQTHKVTR